MTVREVRRQDLYGLLTLYTQLHNNPMPEESQALSALWADILQDRNHHIIVAERGGQIVSSCVLTVIPNLTHGQRPYALIENVITDARHRRQGLAAACLAFAKQIAQECHCYKIMLLTGSREENTLRFYRNAGYNSQDKTAFIQWI
ncbi:GNAT family N-acetyltransferase [Pseudoflavonifractor sp. 524-17]|uniref:GNAT family N-acetyltransferase n=1 Tax=Pseudoflavonifractor sp. 524-17 TaxID=2304577 RepID=UPI00137AEEC1|nr:GNAT family N-acetyltransferase [Pseudoflavonifractor sp. 524-17]NCE64836.1 GNAT family N-acetyltransferase [Pseudoflavonifractor sp. 524-17]